MLRRSILAVLTILAISIAGAVASPLVVRAGGGCHAAAASVYTEGASTVVKTDVCLFVPTVVRVPVGSLVRFLNSDVQDHMVVGRAGTWASAVLSPGQEFAATFTAKGTYPYSCPLHPGMVGAVVVGDGIGVAGGAAVGLPESVVPTSVPTNAAAPSAVPTNAAAPSGKPSAAATARVSSPATPATQPARPDAVRDPTDILVAVLAGVAGVIVGVAGGRFVARRRSDIATS